MPLREKLQTSYGEIDVIRFIDTEEGREVKAGTIDTGINYHFRKGLLISTPEESNTIPTIYIIGLEDKELERAFDIVDELLHDKPYKISFRMMEDHIAGLENLIDDAKALIEYMERQRLNEKF